METLLIFRSPDDRDFDRFILAPRGMRFDEAQTLADSIVAKVKATLDGAGWDEIEDALNDRGFRSIINWIHCEQEV